MDAEIPPGNRPKPPSTSILARRGMVAGLLFIVAITAAVNAYLAGQAKGKNPGK